MVVSSQQVEEVASFLAEKGLYLGEVNTRREVAAKFCDDVGTIREIRWIWDYCQGQAFKGQRRGKGTGDCSGLFMWMLKDIAKCKEVVIFWRKNLSADERPANAPDLTERDVKERMWAMYFYRERGSAVIPPGELMDVSVDGIVNRIADEFGWQPVDVYDVLDMRAMEITTDTTDFPDPVGIRGFDRWRQDAMARARKRLKGKSK